VVASVLDKQDGGAQLGVKRWVVADAVPAAPVQPVGSLGGPASQVGCCQQGVVVGAYFGDDIEGERDALAGQAVGVLNQQACVELVLQQGVQHLVEARGDGQRVILLGVDGDLGRKDVHGKGLAEDAVGGRALDVVGHKPVLLLCLDRAEVGDGAKCHGWVQVGQPQLLAHVVGDVHELAVLAACPRTLHAGKAHVQERQRLCLYDQDTEGEVVGG